MKEITELKTIKKYHNIAIQKTFTSKKNTVAYVLYHGKPRLLKWYAPGFHKNITTEATILTNASKTLNIPTLFEHDTKNHVLIQTYIPGENICDLINHPTVHIKEKQRLIQLIAHWYHHFHTHFKTTNTYLIHGDATLRNLLFTTKIYGVDFEETRSGQPIEDLATLCASLITTTPQAEPYKYQLCTTLLTTYQNQTKKPLPNIAKEIAYAILQKIPYRPSEENTLRTLADHATTHQFIH